MEGRWRSPAVQAAIKGKPMSLQFLFVSPVNQVLPRDADAAMEVGLSFGSVGDIIAVCQLIAELGKALNDATGSPAQYQEIHKELDDFVSLLMQASSLSLAA